MASQPVKNAYLAHYSSFEVYSDGATPNYRFVPDHRFAVLQTTVRDNKQHLTMAFQ